MLHCLIFALIRLSMLAGKKGLGYVAEVWLPNTCLYVKLTP